MASEKRLIDANAVEAKIEKSFRKLIANQNRPDLAAALSYVGDLIIEAPTVDAVEVVHGRWVLGNVEPGYFTPGGNRPWICSKCGEVISYRLDKPMENYCPNCGAKMDGGNEDENP